MLNSVLNIRINLKWLDFASKNAEKAFFFLHTCFLALIFLAHENSYTLTQTHTLIAP